MCTVSVVAAGRAPGFRLACNRDESRRRAAAEPPRRFVAAGRAALAPRDPQGGGTWIAVNDAGVAMAILNRNRVVTGAAGAGRAGAGRKHGGRSGDAGGGRPAESRGAIIPAILGAPTAGEAAARARRIDLAPYPPFRLVVIDGRRIADLTWDAPGLRLRLRTWDRRPVLFTSSGLGDALVGPPRRTLFRRLFAGPGDPVERQDRLHRHSWPDRPHLSVCMRRSGARTVSHAVIDVGPAQARFLYYGDAPDNRVRPVARALRLRRLRPPRAAGAAVGAAVAGRGGP